MTTRKTKSKVSFSAREVVTTYKELTYAEGNIIMIVEKANMTQPKITIIDKKLNKEIWKGTLEDLFELTHVICAYLGIEFDDSSDGG